MINITYNGVDITDAVSVNRCYHDMYSGDRSDTVNIRFNDPQHLWDSWRPSAGDEIRVDYDTATTGTMFLTSAKARNGLFEIAAQSAPQSGFVKQRKSWQKIRLLQLGAEIAERNGLTFVSYGVEDQVYSYIVQDNVGDFAFLAQRARLEGCALQVFDKKLILYSEPYIEALPPAEHIEVDESGNYEYFNRTADLFGSCVVSSGEYSGTFSIENGSVRVYHPEMSGNVSSDAEAERFAKSLLRSVNKGCLGGYIRIPIQAGYAAGSVVALSNSRAASMDGPVFLNHVRNDYYSGFSKVFFRKPLEGY